MIETFICVAIAKEVMFGRIEEVAKEFGVNRDLMTYIVNNEAAKTKEGDFLPCGDGDTHLFDPTGKRHRSRGIVQINKYYHKEIPDSATYNVNFSLEFLATKIREGKCRKEWTTCRNYVKEFGSLPFPHHNT
jgi:hypothetical protein